MTKGRPIILDEKNLETRVNGFKKELEELLKKYNLRIKTVPIISQVPVGNIIINSLDAQIQITNGTDS